MRCCTLAALVRLLLASARRTPGLRLHLHLHLHRTPPTHPGGSTRNPAGTWAGAGATPEARPPPRPPAPPPPGPPPPARPSGPAAAPRARWRRHAAAAAARPRCAGRAGAPGGRERRRDRSCVSDRVQQPSRRQHAAGQQARRAPALRCAPLPAHPGGVGGVGQGCHQRVVCAGQRGLDALAHDAGREVCRAGVGSPAEGGQRQRRCERQAAATSVAGRGQGRASAAGRLDAGFGPAQRPGAAQAGWRAELAEGETDSSATAWPERLWPPDRSIRCLGTAHLPRWAAPRPWGASAPLPIQSRLPGCPPLLAVAAQLDERPLAAGPDGRKPRGDGIGRHVGATLQRWCASRAPCTFLDCDSAAEWPKDS